MQKLYLYFGSWLLMVGMQCGLFIAMVEMMEVFAASTHVEDMRNDRLAALIQNASSVLAQQHALDAFRYSTTQTTFKRVPGLDPKILAAEEGQEPGQESGPSSANSTAAGDSGTPRASAAKAPAAAPPEDAALRTEEALEGAEQVLETEEVPADAPPGGAEPEEPPEERIADALLQATQSTGDTAHAVRSTLHAKHLKVTDLEKSVEQTIKGLRAASSKFTDEDIDDDEFAHWNKEAEENEQTERVSLPGLSYLAGNLRKDYMRTEEARKKSERWVRILLSILVLGYALSDCYRIRKVDGMFVARGSPPWLRWALLAGQALVIYMFVRASVVLVVFSEPQDIVLNGVALTFALELDNYMVKLMYDEIAPDQKLAEENSGYRIDGPRDLGAEEDLVEPLLGRMR